MARSSLAQVLYYYIIYYFYLLLLLSFFISYQYLLLSSRKGLIPILNKYCNSKGMSASRPSPRPLKASLPTHLVFIAIVQILVGQCHHRHHHHHHRRRHWRALLEGGLWNLCLKLTTVEQTIKQLSPDFIILSLASSSLSSLQWHRHPFIVNIMWCQPYTPMIICGTLFSWEAVQPRCLYYYYYYTSNTILIVLVGEDLKRMSFILYYLFISNIKI